LEFIPEFKTVVTWCCHLTCVF